MAVIRLLHGEVVLGNVWLDEYEIIKCYLQGRIAGARSSKGFLNKEPQWQDSTGAQPVSADDRREWPDGLD